MIRIYLGTQGWSYPSWEGPFYPAGTTNKEYLPEYAKHFDTVELDTTFYAIPRGTTIAGWRERTPDGFRFAAKFPKVVTHEKELREAGLEANVFVEAMAGLGDKLGPLLYGDNQDEVFLGWRCATGPGWLRRPSSDSKAFFSATAWRYAWSSTRGCRSWTRSPRRSSTSAGLDGVKTYPMESSATSGSTATYSLTAGLNR